MREMTVLEAKRYGVITCGPHQKLLAAACTMQEHNISTLIVVDEEGYLIGVITRTDLVRACYERLDWEQQPVQAYMNTDVATVFLSDPLLKVMELLLDRHIHRVVAVETVNGRLKPKGVLSAADIVYHMARCQA